MPNAATIEGVQQLRATLDVAAQALEDLSLTNAKAGDLFAVALAGEAPRDTGYLVSTISTQVTAQSATVVVAAPYGAYVNAIDPFKARAIDAATQPVIDLYVAAVVDAVDQIKGQ